jgi:acyl-coenzyme A thioesterase PaaI-like protein
MKLSARQLRWGLNIWPPLIGAGIRVEAISKDFRYARVSMKLRWYNKNYVGTHYGGNLYSMTDPFYMLMLLHNLGSGYYVWDTSGSIDYLAPGRSKIIAEFSLTGADIADIIDRTKSGEKTYKTFEIDLRDDQSNIIAKVKRTLYIKLKPNK